MTREQLIDEAVKRVAWNQSGYIMCENQIRWLARQDQTAVLEHVRSEFDRLNRQPECRLPRPRVWELD